MKIQRLITGSIIILSAILLFAFTIKETLFTLFYVIPAIIIGIVILLNNKEDSIERIHTTGVPRKSSAKNFTKGKK
jgi:uncharacterized membrane protein